MYAFVWYMAVSSTDGVVSPKHKHKRCLLWCCLLKSPDPPPQPFESPSTVSQTRLPGLIMFVLLVQISARKHTGKEPEELEAYAVLTDKVADALLGAAGAVLQPATAPELDFEGSMEEYGRRLCSILALFADLHFAAMPNVHKQYVLIQHVSRTHCIPHGWQVPKPCGSLGVHLSCLAEAADHTAITVFD